MNEWIEHEMDYERVKPYLEEQVFTSNILSEILKTTDFTKGRFFTFLPPEMNLNEIYNLKYAFSCFAVPKGTPYQILPDNSNAAAFIVDKAKTNPRLSCLFDDMYRSPSDKSFINNPNKFVLFYEKEVYYFLRNHQISLDLVEKYLRYSTTFWHSICVLSEVNLNIGQKEVEVSFFEQVRVQAKYILFEAYDADGYLYWEKTGD